MNTWKGIRKFIFITFIAFGAAVFFCLATESMARAADASVVSVSGETVGIDAGSAAGVRRGNLYLVYADGQERLNYDGSFLGREKHNLAVIKISKVSRASGNGSVVSGHAALIQRGHKAEPISARDAEYVSFVEYRPYRPHDPAENWGGGAMPPPPLPPSAPLPSAPAVGYPPAWPQQPQYPPHPSYPPSPSYPSRYPPQNAVPYWPPAIDPEYIAYVNANYSTDPAAVISTYPLYVGEKNTRRVAHLNARKLRGRDAYAAYADLANSYEGDYLAAYEAGEEARRLRDYANAQFWYESALRVNSSYQPAINGLRRLR